MNIEIECLTPEFGLKESQSYRWFLNPSDTAEQKEHRQLYGRPWCIGEDNFRYLLARGLRPEHKFLDFGCGSLRNGVWIIRFLNPGNYYGIDADRWQLEAGARVEIPLHDLGTKVPRLLHNSEFRIDFFQVEYDWIFAFSVLNHLDPRRRAFAIERIISGMKDDAKFTISHRLPFEEQELYNRFRLQVVHEVEWPCKTIPSSTMMFELKRAT